jgi:hypothetical protein
MAPLPEQKRRRRRGARRLAAEERIMAGLLRGETLTECAADLGVSRQYASKLWHESLAERNAEVGAMVDERRAMLDARLEAVLREHWPQRAHPKHAEVILRVLDRKAKLWGLDAPTRLDHSGGMGVSVSVETPQERRARILYEECQRVAGMSDDEVESYAAEMFAHPTSVEALASARRAVAGDVESTAVEVSE